MCSFEVSRLGFSGSVCAEQKRVAGVFMWARGKTFIFPTASPLPPIHQRRDRCSAQHAITPRIREEDQYSQQPYDHLHDGPPDRLHWLSPKTHTHTLRTRFDCHSASPVLYKALFVSPSFNLINFTLMWDGNGCEVWFNLLTDAWWVCACVCSPSVAGHRVRSPSKTFQLLSSAKDSCILEPPKITSAMPINYREPVHTLTRRLWAPEILLWVP